MNDTELLDFILATAASAGADATDAMLARRQSLEISWRLGDLEELERKESRELGLRVFVGRRQACASTSLFDAESLRAFTREVVESARHLPEDPYAGLAESDDLVSGPADLDLVDRDEPTTESLMEAAGAAEDAARSINGITNSEGASAGWSATSTRFAASNGFRGGYGRTRHSLGVTVLAGVGTAMERDGEWRSATHRSALPSPAGIGRVAAERTVRRLGPRKVASATVPVVYDSRVASGLLRHLASAISGDTIAKGSSFLKDALGEPIMSADIVITDDPLRRRGAASRPFDAEGLPVATRRLVDGGMLTTWLLDLATARRLGRSSTGHASRAAGSPPSPAATNLTLAAGKMPPAELIADIKSGFYVTDLMGMGINIVTGDYSRGAAGFWIENGQIAYPVGEMTIAGNLRDMFARMVPADDLEIHGSCDAPTVRIDGMTVAGH